MEIKMTRTETISSLIKIANTLDQNNYTEQSNTIDEMIIRLADVGRYSPSVQYYIDKRHRSKIQRVSPNQSIITPGGTAKKPNKLQQMWHKEKFEEIPDLQNLIQFVLGKEAEHNVNTDEEPSSGTPRNFIIEMFTNPSFASEVGLYFLSRDMKPWLELIIKNHYDTINKLIDDGVLKKDKPDAETSSILRSLKMLEPVLPEELKSKYHAINEMRDIESAGKEKIDNLEDSAAYELIQGYGKGRAESELNRHLDPGNIRRDKIQSYLDSVDNSEDVDTYLSKTETDEDDQILRNTSACIKIANILDNLGYYRLADNLTNISYRLAEEEKEDRELQFLNSPIEHHKERMFDPQHQDEEGTYNFTDLATGKKYYQNPFFGTNFLSEDHHINMKKMNELFGMFQGAISSIRRLELEELKKHRDVKYLKELILRTREYDQRIDDSAEYVSIEEFKDLIKLAERSYSFLRMYRILSPNEIDSKLNIIRAIKQKLQPTT